MHLEMLLIGGEFISYMLCINEIITNISCFSVLFCRGPIWININYLALSGLHHYAKQEGPYQTRCAKLYDKLRTNLLRNILNEHKKTGFFWEQYDDQNGQGIRGHPFTGWTATIVNIFLEKY